MQLAKLEREMLEKAKLQTQNQALRQKEDKQEFMQRMKAYSLVDAKAKRKAHRMAKQLVGEGIDLSEVLNIQDSKSGPDASGQSGPNTMDNKNLL